MSSDLKREMQINDALYLLRKAKESVASAEARSYISRAELLLIDLKVSYEKENRSN